MKPVIKQLQNGLTVVMQRTNAAPVVAYQMWIRVGSADEAPSEEGLAHVLEHMLFKGTKRRPVGEIARDVERAGGRINAWTSHDETVFFITLANRYWEQGLDIVADAVQHSSLDEQELMRELSVIREEIRMGEDSPERTVVQRLFDNAFKKHPYGRPVIGFDRTVKALTRETVNGFYRRWYVPSNMVFVIAGDFDEEVMFDKITQLFSTAQAASPPERVTRVNEPEQRKRRISMAINPISEVHLALGFPIPGIDHEDTPALDLLAAILGQGASSRFETNIRRKLSLVSGIRVIAYTPKDAGLLGVFATTPTHNLKAATRAIAAELKRAMYQLPSQADMDKAKTMLISEKIYSEETVDGIARKTGFYQTHTGTLEFEQRYNNALAELSPEDITAVARRYIAPSRASMSVVVPDPSRRPPEKPVPWIIGKKQDRQVDKSKLKTLLDTQIEQGFKGADKRVPNGMRAGKTVVRELSSGDILLVNRDPSSKLVAARAAFLGGLRLESASECGVFALLSNTIVRGTKNRSADQVAATMDNLACAIGGFAGRNTIGMHGEFLASNFRDGFGLMAECLRSASFPPLEVEREKQLLIEDIRASRDNPSQVAFQLFQKKLFGSHPYSRPIRGDEDTIGKIDSAALRKNLKRYTKAGSMVLAVVGGVNIEEVTEWAETLVAGQGAKGRAPKGPGPWTPPSEPGHLVQSLPKEQSHIVIGFPGTTITSDDRFAIEVMTEILGGHGGRLFAGVRDEKGLAYAVTAMSMEGIEPGYLAFYAATQPGQEEQVTQAILHEIELICREAASVDEVERIKRFLIGARAIAWQRASTRAASMALDHLYGNGHDEAERYPQKIDRITRKSVQEVAGRYLGSNTPTVAWVGPNMEKITLF